MHRAGSGICGMFFACVSLPLFACLAFPSTGHPTCLKYSPELVERICTEPWQCIECKTCCLCGEGGNAVGWETRFHLSDSDLSDSLCCTRVQRSTGR